MRAPARLYVRLTLALMLPLLAAVAVGATLAIRLLEQTWTIRVHDELAASVGLLATGELPFTPGMLARFAELQRAEYAVMAEDGGIVLSTLRDIPEELRQAARESARSAAPARDLTIEVAGTPNLVLIRPVAGRASGPYRAVLAMASLADARRASARAAGLFTLALIGAGLGVALISYYLVRGVTRPLERVAQMADRIALGERDVRLDLSRTDEVGALARAVDAMAGKLAAYERQLEARARVAALGELAARTAHEIRNPLTAIKLHLQLLAEQLDAAQAGRVARILGEVRRLELVADATLAVGQEQPLVRSQTDLAALAGEVVELMQPALQHRGISIESRLANPAPQDLDPRRLKQVLLNLIVNAADALGSGGRIRVSVERPAAGAPTCLTVEDSGVGIAPERLAHIFDGGVSDKPYGFGLGLVVSRDIVRQHGGNLRADSSPELGGARFTVELPPA